MTDNLTIAAAICWYDEPAESLTRCVASLAGFVDRVVTIDGAYSHFPHVDPRSPQHQHDALEKAARLAGIPHLALAPTDIPPTQAEKRTRLYRAASSGTDWILIIDADEVLECAGARASLTRSGSGFDAATALVIEGESERHSPRLLRSSPTLVCGPTYHGMLSATDTDGRRVCIRDRREIIMRENPRPRRSREMDLSKQVRITNYNNERCDERKAAKHEYVRRRMRDGIDL